MKQITAVGIDVSKGRSMVAARQTGGVIVATPLKINHTATKLNQLIKMLHQYPGVVRIVMEHTGAYWRPVALALVNTPPYQSGDFEPKSRRVSKRGSPLLRRTTGIGRRPRPMPVVLLFLETIFLT